MKLKTEDRFANMRASMDEIRSSMVILLQAVKNKHDMAELTDINNHLEIVINKTDSLIEEANNIYNEIFAK